MTKKVLEDDLYVGVDHSGKWYLRDLESLKEHRSPIIVKVAPGSKEPPFKPVQPLTHWVLKDVENNNVRIIPDNTHVEDTKISPLPSEVAFRVHGSYPKSEGLFAADPQQGMPVETKLSNDGKNSIFGSREIKSCSVIANKGSKGYEYSLEVQRIRGTEELSDSIRKEFNRYIRNAHERGEALSRKLPREIPKKPPTKIPVIRGKDEGRGL